MKRLFSILLPLLSLFFTATILAAADYTERRHKMVERIVQEVALTSKYIDKELLAPVVIEAMGSVPRHQFVPDGQRSYAYENRPLSIGYGQTISQPYIVALMTNLARLKPGGKVLEIGTGSGYQAAILAELTDKVFTIEIVEELGKEVRQRFDRLGYERIQSRVGDGYYGWESEAPFDVILVTAASSHVPPSLIKQLRPGGRMIIPLGGRFQVQQLMLIEKTPQGEIRSKQILPVRFVPLTGKH